MRTVLSDINSVAVWAGVTAFVWYAFGAVPLHIAVAGQLGLTSAESSSWIFIIWTSGAVASTPFSFVGITSALWAVVAGIGASLLAERRDLFSAWRESNVQTH